MNSIKLIAEIGWNHMGDMNLAKKMVDAQWKVAQILLNFRHGQLKT